MKKIKRIGDNGGNVVYVYESDLDELEQKMDEAVDVLVECQTELRCLGHESISLGMESSSPLLRKVRMIIIKLSGKTWEEIKAGKG